MPSLLLHLLGDGAREVVGLGAGDGLVLEAANAVELRLAQPIEKEREILLGLAGEADDERRADGEIGADLAPIGNALGRLFLMGRTAHGLQHGGRGVLERDIEIGENLALGHQRDDVVDVRVGIDVVEPGPGAELAQGAGEIEEAGLERRALPGALRIFQVEAVGAGVLADDQQFLHAGLHQALGLGHDMVRRAARQVATQTRDDAERAAVVAAFRDLQIGVVTGREAQAFRRDEIEVGVVQRRHGVVHGGDDLLVLMRAGDGEHARVHLADTPFFDAHAAGDDDATVFGKSLADGVEALLLGAIEEATGVDDNHIGAGVVGRDLISLGAQLGDDALAVDKGLRAPKRDEADLGGRFGRGPGL